METDLHKTWSDVAYHWDKWGPPLRPCAEDLSLMREAMADWHAETRVEKPRVFLCGVTPEIVTMDWPFPIELLAMDQAQSMVKVVWPGDVAGVRQAVVGSWLTPELPAASFDLVINDGGFGFFDFPRGLRELLASMRRLLKPGGLFVGRDFSQISPRESLLRVLDDARNGSIGSFHAFKWRLAMALQHTSSVGVQQKVICRAWSDAQIDATKLPQPGWSSSAVSTIEFYRGKEARLYFPTADEFQRALSRHFQQIVARYPRYELGERCPIFMARVE
jgi:SAM-dependent methyltransferase